MSMSVLPRSPIYNPHTHTLFTPTMYGTVGDHGDSSACHESKGALGEGDQEREEGEGMDLSTCLV